MVCWEAVHSPKRPAQAGALGPFRDVLHDPLGAGPDRCLHPRPVSGTRRLARAARPGGTSRARCEDNRPGLTATLSISRWSSAKEWARHVDLPLNFHPAVDQSLGGFYAVWRGGSNVRSAALVWVAPPIACCGEVGGVGRRGEIAQRRVRTPLIVIADPVRDRCPRMSEAEEEGFVKKLIPHPAIKTLAEAVLHGLARRDEVPGNLVL